MSFFESILYMIWRGVAIGIIISAPMGPVGILCVQRTLEKGRRTGLYTGIGAAISDLFYCLLTGFGLSFIEVFLERNQNIIQLVGSVVLIAFAVYLFKSNPSRKLKTPEQNHVSVQKNILNGFLFTFSNPLIIFLIIGLFARFNFMLPELLWYNYVIGYLSIAAGALLWWWIVTFFVEKVRSHFNLRSMWLINKIIGGVVLIFAIVGIVTSSVAMAKAEERKPIYMNAARGFGSFDAGNEKILLIEDSTGSTSFKSLRIEDARDFILSFRARNLHNDPRKRYTAMDASGHRSRVRMPGWGCVLKSSSGDSILIRINTGDDHRDNLYDSAKMHISISSSAESVDRSLTEGIDLYTGQNAFRILFKEGRLSLLAGNHGLLPIAEFDTGIPSICEISFITLPGGRVEISDFALEFAPQSSISVTEFGNPDILATYLMRSKDKMEGIWKIYDRMMDEDYLRPAGDYKFAIVADPESSESGDYLIVYLDGATICADRWLPGMIKARLRSSGFKNIWTVDWNDAEGVPVKEEVKAEFDPPSLLLSFPYHNSTLRLRKLISH